LLSKLKIKGNNINNGNLIKRIDFINNIESGFCIKRLNETKKINIKKNIKYLNGPNLLFLSK